MIAGLLAIFGLLAVGGVLYLEREPEEEVVLWGAEVEGAEAHEIRRLNDLLKATVLSCDFKENAFSDCFLRLNEALVTDLGLGEINFVFHDEADLEVPISLRLADAPLAEILRYLTSLNQLKYRVDTGRTVAIVPLDDLGSREVTVGWFEAPRPVFRDVSSEREMREMFETFGATFAPTDTLEYFPYRDLLKVESTAANLEKVDLYLGSICILYRPTLRDWVGEWWGNVIGRGFPTTPATAPSLPSTSVAPSSSGGSAAPDPFGGSSVSGSTDPFSGASP